jgi:hypothetical protein
VGAIRPRTLRPVCIAFQQNPRSPVKPLLLLGLLLQGCAITGGEPGTHPCFKAGRACAAAQAPSGMRQVFRGHRVVSSRWLEKTNRESGLPDIGIQARWEPFVERR